MSRLLDRLKVTVRPGKPWNNSATFIVLWPITAKMRTHKLATKPQTNQRSCLQVSFFTSDWLFTCNTITFQKYFWFSWFSLFDCNSEKCTYRGLSSSLQEIHFIRNKHIQIERNRINQLNWQEAMRGNQKHIQRQSRTRIWECRIANPMHWSLHHAASQQSRGQTGQDPRIGLRPWGSSFKSCSGH